MTTLRQIEPATPTAPELLSVERKAWHQSREVWVNVLTALSMVLALSELGSILPPDFGKYTTFALAVVNIIMRVFFTAAPIAARARA